ncbi:MAG: hypothetical protein OQJ93_02995, partial [Ignavibacteriaceae bacterium]|nr:hypothetical protein [Ignavibacteriaceae bacterium]
SNYYYSIVFFLYVKGINYYYSNYSYKNKNQFSQIFKGTNKKYISNRNYGKLSSAHGLKW